MPARDCSPQMVPEFPIEQLRGALPEANFLGEG